MCNTLTSDKIVADAVNKSPTDDAPTDNETDGKAAANNRIAAEMRVRTNCGHHTTQLSRHSARRAMLYSSGGGAVAVGEGDVRDCEDAAVEEEEEEEEDVSGGGATALVGLLLVDTTRPRIVTSSPTCRSDNRASFNCVR